MKKLLVLLAAVGGALAIWKRKEVQDRAAKAADSAKKVAGAPPEDESLSPSDTPSGPPTVGGGASAPSTEPVTSTAPPTGTATTPGPAGAAGTNGGDAPSSEGGAGRS